MKKQMLVSSTLALLMTLIAVAQNPTKADDTKQNNAKAEKGATKMVKIAGNVSSDGKTLVNVKDNRAWIVSNPDALKGHEGQKVTVKGHVDADQNEIQVVSVKSRRPYGHIPKQP